MTSNTAVTLVSNIFATFAVRIAFPKSKSRIGITMIRFFGKRYSLFAKAEVSLTGEWNLCLLVMSQLH